MSKISKSTRKKAIPIILLMVLITLSSAFYIVWVQQQISRTAQSSKLLEADLAESSRKLRYTDERIARSHQPVVLQGKVTSTLRPLVKKQVVFVREREHANRTELCNLSTLRSFYGFSEEILIFLTRSINGKEFRDANYIKLLSVPHAAFRFYCTALDITRCCSTSGGLIGALE